MIKDLCFLVVHNLVFILLACMIYVYYKNLIYGALYVPYQYWFEIISAMKSIKHTAYIRGIKNNRPPLSKMTIYCKKKDMYHLFDLSCFLMLY